MVEALRLHSIVGTYGILITHRGWGEVDEWREPFQSLRRDQKALGFETHAPLGGQGLLH